MAPSSLLMVVVHSLLHVVASVLVCGLCKPQKVLGCVCLCFIIEVIVHPMVLCCGCMHGCEPLRHDQLGVVLPTRAYISAVCAQGCCITQILVRSTTTLRFESTQQQVLPVVEKRGCRVHVLLTQGPAVLSSSYHACLPSACMVYAY